MVKIMLILPRTPCLVFLVLFSSAVAMAGGIEIGTPLVAGNVTTYEKRQKTGETDLSLARLQAAFNWLEQHRSGWVGEITPGSSEPVRFEVALKHRDGHITTMSVIAAASGGYDLRVTGPGTMAYRSLGGLFQSWAATRSLSDQNVAALRRLFGVT